MNDAIYGLFYKWWFGLLLFLKMCLANGDWMMLFQLNGDTEGTVFVALLCNKFSSRGEGEGEVMRGYGYERNIVSWLFLMV